MINDHISNSVVAMFKRFEFRFFTTFLGEIVALTVLWLFWIIGAAIASVCTISILRVTLCLFLLAVHLGRPFLVSAVQPMPAADRASCIRLVGLDHADGTVGRNNTVQCREQCVSATAARAVGSEIQHV